MGVCAHILRMLQAVIRRICVCAGAVSLVRGASPNTTTLLQGTGAHTHYVAIRRCVIRDWTTHSCTCQSVRGQRATKSPHIVMLSGLCAVHSEASYFVLPLPPQPIHMHRDHICNTQELQPCHDLCRLLKPLPKVISLRAHLRPT